MVSLPELQMRDMHEDHVDEHAAWIAASLCAGIHELTVFAEKSAHAFEPLAALREPRSGANAWTGRAANLTGHSNRRCGPVRT